MGVSAPSAGGVVSSMNCFRTARSSLLQRSSLLMVGAARDQVFTYLEHVCHE